MYSRKAYPSTDSPLAPISTKHRREMLRSRRTRRSMVAADSYTDLATELEFHRRELSAAPKATIKLFEECLLVAGDINQEFIR